MAQSRSNPARKPNLEQFLADSGWVAIELWKVQNPDWAFLADSGSKTSKYDRGEHVSAAAQSSKGKRLAYS